MEEWLLILLKLLIILGASGLIGLEREITGHKAGIRTQILVGLGSTTLVMLGVHNDMKLDETARMIAGIATGIGFLGAGAIMKEGLNVKGLTTAATIWVNAAIGAAIGLGSYMIGISTLILTMLVLSVFALVERLFHLKPAGGTLMVILKRGGSGAFKVVRLIEEKGIEIRSIDLDNSRSEELLRTDIYLKRKRSVIELIEDIRRIKGVQDIKWEDSEKGIVPGMLKVS
ncbi:MAG: MgtC/SapB family protein [Candidatus Thermoplasmatota archaeon]|nr:MgtC/SapB family protein [Candidatus Thermoplasmatota archaeon]